MAKKNKARSHKSKPPAKNAPKAAGCSGKADAGKSAKPGRELPEPRVTAKQARGFEAQVRSLIRQMQLVVRQQRTLDQRLEQDRQERQQQAATPAPPSPHDEAFAALLEFMAEMRERVGGIESRLQQPPRDPSLDVPLSVVQQRVMFAGACKTLNLIRPTPAIVGRAMHSEKATSRAAAKSPYVIFNAIYGAAKRSLGLQGSRAAESTDSTEDFIHLDTDMVSLMEGRSTRPKKKHATYYDDQLSPRLGLLKNMGLADVEKNQCGKRTTYSRYLTPSGSELFNGWPEWTDATGGIGLAEEQAESPHDPARSR